VPGSISILLSPFVLFSITTHLSYEIDIWGKNSSDGPVSLMEARSAKRYIKIGNKEKKEKNTVYAIIGSQWDIRKE
jgi:hypothetical protein